MKLREYMRLLDEGAEVTCWDKDVDSEFYFYNESPDKAPDPGFVNYYGCMERLIDVLDVVKIHDGGVEVNLYEVLDNPVIIQYAKDNLYEDYQYEDNDDVVMLLFDDNDKNISQGFDGFSKHMVKCLTEAYGEDLDKQKQTDKVADSVRYSKIMKCDLEGIDCVDYYENCFLLTGDAVDAELEVDLIGEFFFNTEFMSLNRKEVAIVKSVDELIDFCRAHNIKVPKECLVSDGTLKVGGDRDYVLNQELLALGWEEDLENISVDDRLSSAAERSAETGNGESSEIDFEKE